MRKILAAAAALTLGLSGVLALAAPASATPTDPNADHKVTICHRTGSADGGNQHNGYTVVTVDIASSGYVKGGHTGHEQVGNGPGGDIIPVYDAFAKVHGEGNSYAPFHFPGKNTTLVDGSEEWDAFIANGCSTEAPPVATDVSVDFFDPTCESDAGILTDYNDEAVTVVVDGKVAAGETVTVTFTANEGYVIKGESVFEHTYGEVPDDCIPTKDDKVVVGEWVDGTYKCDDTTVEQTREVTTTSYVWDAEMQDFFVEDTTTVTETRTRDLTSDEQTSCPTDNPNPPKNDNNPPKDNPPAELPGTGAGDILPWAGLGIVLLLSGLLAYMVTNRRRSSI
jgi:hypothetical protein